MTGAQIRRVLKEKYPDYCECGGVLDYAFQFGRVFMCCKKCTPVVKVKLSKKLTGERRGE